MAHFGMNLRVTMDSKQGGRKYMEDVLAVKFQKTDDGRNIEYTYLAVFDGHGGAEAAKFAKEHLLTEITKLKGFWSDDDDQVTQAIREGFLSTHRLMWKAVGTWPKTLTGYPSTAGTTASVVFIRNGKMYVAHVGDSTVVMGMKQQPGDDEDEPVALSITDDHKPDAPKELQRIEEGGGQVVAKSGVQRVVWHRPKVASGPVRRSTNVDSIPFLAIARALGDLWSYNAASDTFVVSPDPDIATFTIDLKQHKFVILASDGLWNMVKPQEAVDIVHELDPQSKDPYMGRKPASLLLHIALDRWSKRMLRADNTSVIVAYFDPPGIHKDNLLRQPSDLSIASTLKATSDGEEDEVDDDDDPEMDEIFPSVGPDDEESHQATGALFDRRKPALKRLSPSPANFIKHSRSSPATSLNKGSKKGAKVDAENDPKKGCHSANKSLGKRAAHKRAASDDETVIPYKRAHLASPESSHIADSPMFGGLPSASRQPLHCSVPLQMELGPEPSTSSSPSADSRLISPLWPSHLADDLMSDNAMSEPAAATLIKPLCASSTTSSIAHKPEDGSLQGPSPLSSQNKPSVSAPSVASCSSSAVKSSRKSRGESAATQRTNARQSPVKLNAVNRIRTMKKAKS